MAMSGDEIWQAVLSGLEKTLNKQSFETWFVPTKLVRYTGSALEVAVPNKFCLDWIKEHYVPLITEIIKGLAEKEMGIVLSVDESIKPAMPPPEPLPIQQVLHTPPPPVDELNPKYIFENFVVGENNHFAQAASLAVAEIPAEAYNPLFIYGKVGLGKTHLLQAIGHFIKKRNPAIKVKYVSSEKFTNDFIDGIAHNQMENFRNVYRTPDVLLIDDIQFIVEKERVQEEFFHTFNELHESHRQIVLSSDRAPKEMVPLEERIRSRFEWGLIVDIQSPDLETRIAILRKKMEAEGTEIPEDVVVYIANRIKYNIRELEGTLTKLLAYSSLMKKDITLSMARDVLKEIFSLDSGKEISVELVQRVVARAFGIRFEDMKVKRRDREIVFPRQVAMYLARELTDFSLPEIGREFGKRDHTTVIHSYNKVQEKLKADPELYNKLKKIREELEK
ncbi:chromosomal replication initiation protein DnaA [Candidatus Desantisbacteria bacterium CG1_02_49_89]|nr:MAG: chromosomal replication initiation protein DnaA [Candidatus Desantisbacteria bacterium CG1_02_49_89]